MKLRLLPGLFFLVGLLSVPGQKPAGPVSFTGTVVDLTDDDITVEGVVAGSTRTEKLTFDITDDTKFEGEVEMQCRVTIRYVPDEQGDSAMSIKVLPAAVKKK